MLTLENGSRVENTVEVEGVTYFLTDGGKRYTYNRFAWVDNFNRVLNVGGKTRFQTASRAVRAVCEVFDTRIEVRPVSEAVAA